MRTTYNVCSKYALDTKVQQYQETVLLVLDNCSVYEMKKPIRIYYLNSRIGFQHSAYLWSIRLQSIFFIS
jgi:hypothetical protein